MKKSPLLPSLCIAGVLSACGGGSDSNSSKSSSSSAISSTVASAVSSIAASEVPAASSIPASSSTSFSSAPANLAWVCPATGLYFCDDFGANNSDKWNLKPTTLNSLVPTGLFDVADDSGNYVLRYTAADIGGVIALVKPEAFTGVTSADYYVEAKIRPRTNSTTGNKQIYLITRYVDGNNWYAGALNVQNANTSTQVEIAKMKAGSISRPKQVKKPIDQGTQGMLDGKWYTLRIETLGSNLTVYLDGETIATTTDADFSATGLVGLWTANKSFEIDDVKVGNASDKPASLLISPTATSYAAEVGDAGRVITVTAKTDTGAPDTFTVVSSNNAVVSASTNGAEVSLMPVGEGTATITFTSTSNPDLVRIISASIAPQFVMPTATYNLTGLTVPAVADINAYEDTTLKLTFDGQPTLGTSGSIRIFKSSDNTLVDKIALTDESDAIGFGTLRSIKTRPVRINGNTASISLHANKLELGTSYYVAISPAVFTGATLSGQTFAGIGKDTGWSFTTRAAGPDITKTSITVDDNGSVADFRSVQAALNFVMKNVALDTPAIISVRNGTYEEPLYLRTKNNLTIQGESRTDTVIQYPNNELLNSGSEGRALMLVATADMLTLDTLTLKNTTLIGVGGQAETLYFNSPNGRLIAKNANFISEQDTLLLKGWTWFYDTLVAGNVDFIWGYSKASLFEKSEIRSLGRSTGNSNGGYVLQARVEAANDKGFVFLNSRLTGGAGPTNELPIDGSHYLARSPGGTSTFDNIVFVNTKIGTHIAAGGWAGLGVNSQPAANPATGTATTGWREYNSMDLSGAPLNISGRQFGYTLSLAEAAGYCNRAQVFAAYNSGAGWNPLPDDNSDCVNAEGTVTSSSSSSAASSEVSSSVDNSSVSSGLAGGNSSSNLGSSSLAQSSAESSGSSSAANACVGANTVQGFAAMGNSTTGGADIGLGNNTVTVSNGVDLNNVLSATNPTYKDKPLVVYITGTITWANSSNSEIRVRRSNVSIIGNSNSEFSGVGIRVSHGASNIVIRNLLIHEVPQANGAGDHIHLDGQDGAVSNIWIDHNEFYNDLTVDKDFYDELVSGRSRVHNVTISHNYFHDSQKTSLWGSSDDTTAEDVGRTISFHHNYWKDVVSRLPLFRFGEGHVWNNYYNGVTGSGINSRMGAKMRVDNNVFESVKNAIWSGDSASVGFWHATGNTFANSIWSGSFDASCSTPPCYAGGNNSTVDYQPPYSYAAMDASAVKTYVLANAGRNKIDTCLDLPEISPSSSSAQASSVAQSSSSSSAAGAAMVNEDFAAADASAFFSSAYKAMPGDSSKALYRVTGGGSNIVISAGQLSMTNGRFTIGDVSEGIATAAGSQPNGAFNLTQPYRVKFTITSVTGTGNIQVYVDNNTTGAGNSIHSSIGSTASRLMQIAANTITSLPHEIVIESGVGTANSFFQIRADSSVSNLTIDNLAIEYQ